MYAIRSYYGRIGLILQEPFLYSRTLKDNIRIAAPEADEHMVEGAAGTACADGFIKGFEKGYDTLVGERGVTLSGGQQQRVAIARTLLKRNDIPSASRIFVLHDRKYLSVITSYSIHYTKLYD